MREIKFRGLCAIGKEMVFGDLIHGVSHKQGQVYILPNKHNLAYVKHCDPLDGVRVIPETVGQYIGQTDKNGNDMFEDDIVKSPTGDVFQVVFRNSSFVLRKADGVIWSISFSLSAWEVIGNIHENPELINP